ncbi:MAG: SRPBCC family protein [Actinomycetota bacterium]
MQTTDAVTSNDQYAFGARVTLSCHGRTSLSAQQVWSGLDDYLALQGIVAHHADTPLETGPVEETGSGDDYLALQRILAHHADTRLETGPGKSANGIGATIAFDFMNGVVREVLIEKDDVNYVWRISMPEANTLFSFFEGTARIDSMDVSGCDVSYSIDCILASPDRATRAAIIDHPTPPGPTRVDELARFVLERDGVVGQITFPVACPIERLWGVVGSWGDVSWINGAKSTEVTATDRRVVYFEDGTRIDERMWSRDEKTHTLVYEPLGGPMPVRMYLGTLRLEDIGRHRTQVTYTHRFIAKDGLNPSDVKTALAAAFRARFAWVQKRFAVSGAK